MAIKYHANGDHAGLALGVAIFALGIFNTVTGIQILHAVVRRLVAEACHDHDTNSLCNRHEFNRALSKRDFHHRPLYHKDSRLRLCVRTLMHCNFDVLSQPQ